LPAQQIVNRHRTDNTDAYTEYLLGNQFRALDTKTSNRQALDAYQKALALDPSYAAGCRGCCCRTASSPRRGPLPAG
jgi:hypothetical protein